ncbi:MAG: FAA hydrolase family protein [Chitinophagaceae bacterium]|nr:MAG: FAA hydrolase family protein [Chitinophagaceae bacterium]
MKIICVGRNYIDHAHELNNPVPEKPVLFLKPDTAILKNNDDFYYPEFSKDIHYEAELVVKIIKPGKYIKEEFAYRYFDSVTVGIDFTARDLQAECKQKSLPWEIAKAFDNSAAIGEWVEMKDLKADFNNLNFNLLKNDKKVQIGNAADMIFNIEYLISYISTYFSLKKGDLIFTGTPSGVGPVKAGDKLTAFLEEKEVLHFAIR